MPDKVIEVDLEARFFVCPFEEDEDSHCHVLEENHCTVGPAPDWCPLRNGPVLVKAKE